LFEARAESAQDRHAGAPALATLLAVANSDLSLSCLSNGWNSDGGGPADGLNCSNGFRRAGLHREAARHAIRPDGRAFVTWCGDPAFTIPIGGKGSGA
jgi:hypothetical protein